LKANFADGDPKRAEKYILRRHEYQHQSKRKRAGQFFCSTLWWIRAPTPAQLDLRTKGIFSDYPPRIFLDGEKQAMVRRMVRKKKTGKLSTHFGRITSIPSGRRPESWRARWAATAELELRNEYRLMDWPEEGLVPDINVYDAAAWSRPLIERGIGRAERASQKFRILPAASGSWLGFSGLGRADVGATKSAVAVTGDF